MVAGMGIEITHWTVVKLELQRTADVASLAGAMEYALASNAQDAANEAANVAELNGATGTQGQASYVSPPCSATGHLRAIRARSR